MAAAQALAQATGSRPVLVDVAAGEDPAGGFPVPGQTQINIRNEHMQYILIWYSLSAATLAMWLLVKPGRRPAPNARRLPQVRT